MPGTTHSANRVRRNTASSVNRDLDTQIRSTIEHFAGRGEKEISARIEELNREWDVERWLETNASSVAITGLLLGLTVNKKWLIVPGVVLPFLLQHAVQGWCPPLPLLRRLGIRTREEIDLEKYALKALRGDFVRLSPGDAEAAYGAASA